LLSPTNFHSSISYMHALTHSHVKNDGIIRASPPHTGKQRLYFRIEYSLMITVPTHKRHTRHL
jgi:hypothetical protein